MTKEDLELSMMIRAGLCLSYGFSSAALTFVNRSLYALYQYKSPLSLLLVQCICNISICLTLMSIKSFISHTALDFLGRYGIRISSLGEMMSKAKAGLIISSIKIFEVLLGLYSLKAVNLPLFLTLRRCCIVNTMIIEKVYQGKNPQQSLIIATMFVCGGAIVAGYDSLHENIWGYILIMGNNFTSGALYSVANAYNEKKVVHAFDLNFFFASIGLPLSYIITYYNGELFELQKIFFGSESATADVTMCSYILISGSFGILITMTALLCVTLNGPFSVNITGIFKDVIMTFVGFIILNDTSVTTAKVIGMSLSFIGAFYYSMCKYQEGQKTPVKVSDDKKKA